MLKKVAILASYDKLPKIRQCNAAVQLKISQSILCIINNKKVKFKL
jgi:hypothetical protein